MSKITLEGHIDITSELPIPEGKIVNKPLYVSDEEYISKDAFIEQQRKQYCKNCERRKGTKNGERIFVYEIGEAPCRACDIEDMIDAVWDFIPADVAPVVYAHWIREYHENESYPIHFLCSNCRFCTKTTKDEGLYYLKYCSMCGAKMDKVSEVIQ